VAGRGRTGARLAALPSQDGTTLKMFKTFVQKWLKLMPESGLDCLMCSDIKLVYGGRVRQDQRQLEDAIRCRASMAHIRHSTLDSGLGLNRFQYESL